MIELARRRFLALAGAAAIAPAAAAQPARSRMIIVNALGGLGDMGLNFVAFAREVWG